MKKRIGIIAGAGGLLLIAGLLIAGAMRTKPTPQETPLQGECTDVGGVEAVLDITVTDYTTETASMQDDDTPAESSEKAETGEESEYDKFAIAEVEDYVNVRNQPSVDGDIVGRIYDGAVAEVLETVGEGEEEWYKITSGNVEGYIKAEFFLYGEEAAEVMDEYVKQYAVVNADRLNVRAEQSTDAACIGHVNNGKKVEVIEDCGEWIHIRYTEQKEGYVSSEFVTLSSEFTYAKTMEEIQAEQVANQGTGTIPIVQNIVFPETSYGSNEELRKGIVDYAMQYVGYPYVSGGSSLATGTDCSGFTCFIYKDFGYSLDRTPQGQFNNAGRSIDYSEIKPGDIICYSSNGGKSCTHVALYIGDGQIVHAANSRKGVITGAADYSPIIGIRNVID